MCCLPSCCPPNQRVLVDLWGSSVGLSQDQTQGLIDVIKDLCKKVVCDRLFIRSKVVQNELIRRVKENFPEADHDCVTDSIIELLDSFSKCLPEFSERGLADCLQCFVSKSIRPFIKLMGCLFGQQVADAVYAQLVPLACLMQILPICLPVIMRLCCNKSNFPLPPVAPPAKDWKPATEPRC